MIQMIETMMPSSSIDFSVALMIISICALIDILSPGVLGVTGYLLLTQPHQLPSRLFMFIFIVQLGYFITGLLLYFGGETLLKLIEHFSKFDFINWFYTVAGAILVVISFIKPSENSIQRITSWIPRQTTIRGMIFLGIIIFLTEFVTALPYFYSISLMNHLAMKPASSVLIIIGYNIVMVLPSLLLLGVNILFKEKLQSLLNKIRSKLMDLPITSILGAVGLVGVVFFNIGIRGILN